MRQEEGKITHPKVIFEDEIILAVNKPAGLVVNRSDTTQNIPTLQEWLEEYLKLPGLGIGNRAGIVHRLDKDTSGIIVVAKTQPAFENLQSQFKERRVEKKYLALGHGRIEPPNGTIKASVSRSPFNRKKFGVFLGGREAETEYKILGYYDPPFGGLGTFSLVELRPKTGRTHQIRVHLKHIGHPVVGDEVYAGRKTYQADRIWCPRQFLHAMSLAVIHPQTGKKVEFSSPLPADLKKALSGLARHQ
jgi:23S rRNA pseudouridine1911/1915/1917 synthase